jgi:hypothetical protein
MTFQHSTTSFGRLFSHVRRGAIVMALVVGSTAAAMATPLTQTSNFGFGSGIQISTFDTNLGALLDIRIQLNYTLKVNTDISTDRIDDWCSATITGANVTVSAPGTPALVSSSLGRTTEFLACDSYVITFIQMDAANVDPLYFDAFTSVGPSTLPLIITRGYDSVTMTAYNPMVTRDSVAGWDIGGNVTYTYTPVPEPTTAVMLTLGIAGMAARRYRRRA